MTAVNVGTPGQDAGRGVAAAIYIQSPTISTSGRFPIPQGCKRIEALLCGGGGGGNDGGGGFGGCGVFEIPVVGTFLDVVIGAGGAAASVGSLTYISAAGTIYAKIGGGGGGNGISGAFGGSGAGGGVSGKGGDGGIPPIGKLLWWVTGDGTTGAAPSSYFLDSAVTAKSSAHRQLPAGAGPGGQLYNDSGTIGGIVAGNGSLGGGGGGAAGASAATAVAADGGGGSKTGTAGGNGSLGGGGGGDPGGGSGGGNGGSLVAISIWGYQGQVNGAGTVGTNGGGGGGGGMLGAGAAAATVNGGAGGNGGGGGGGKGSGTAGAGGNGFAALRFYF